MAEKKSPYVSIIIPTFKDWSRLQLCLDALYRQTFPTSDFEVVVVNNDSDAKPDSLVLQPNVKIITELKTGSYAARNAGLSIVQGEIIGFTDSDCIPDVNWITRAVNLMRSDPGIDRVTGPIKIFRVDAGSWLAWKFESITAFNQKRNVNQGVSVTANLFARKKAFEKVGNFDSGLYSSGDVEWNRRATSAGLNIVFSDAVAVMHPARTSFGQILAKSRRVAGGGYVIAKRHKRLILYILRHFVPPLRYVKVLMNDDRHTLSDVVFAGLVYWCLKMMMVIEIIRLYFGGKPLR